MGSHTEEKRLIRYAVVSSVLARVAAGMTKSAAIAEVCTLVFRDGKEGRVVRLSKRNLYRWIALFKERNIDGLCPKSRQRKATALSSDFVSFLIAQKQQDPKASIPDIIRAAEKLAIVKPCEVARTTAWRAAVQLNLPLLGTPAKNSVEKRRFAFLYRMQMVLCDGKHFRAGVKKRKRVVFTFLDDATRKALLGVVGRSETKVLFLQGLYRTVCRYGLMRCIYVDHGSGFIAKDVEIICARLGIALIFGRERYPEGRGKIERFNQTLGKDLLRTFAGDSSVDASSANLELRIDHYFREDYNKTKHESLGKSPAEKWSEDPTPLETIDDIETLTSKFIISRMRKVSADNIVKIDGKNYEIPFGYAGKRVLIMQNFVYGTIKILHKERMINILPLNLAANATMRRGNRAAKKNAVLTPTRTAARISFEKTYETLVNATGDCFDQIDKE